MTKPALLGLGVALGLLLPACGDDSPGTAEGLSGAETGGDGDGDAGDGDGDGETSDGDGETGDGDGDSGDGDGDSGDGDGDSGDGDGDSGDGDGDGDSGDGDGEPGDGDGEPGDGDGEPGDGDGDEPQGVCGNGIIEPGEQCDDGNNSNNDGCLANCVEASCGDGFVNQGVEVCDDGVNDGSYGGCAANCQALGPHCGDGQLNGPEDCDDANEDLSDGCLDNCSIPASCLTLLEYEDSLTNGAYLVKPDGYNGQPFEVWCDMETDGGGYTFLKIDAGSEHFAPQAETVCADHGMQLWIPRSLAHRTSGWEIAHDDNIGGSATALYMRILGVYPNFNGAQCRDQPLNSGNPNCNWSASDNGPFFVHDVNYISEPNGDNNVNQSQYYDWNGDGDIQWHNDTVQGFSSAYFMCDVGDKLP
ncbi:MAG: fibrinogen-like YCDxxxxGGGW domain-containing protein [Enhygromyxa sp.]